MEMFEHLPGCTPLEPCNNCKAMAIMRGKIEPETIRQLDTLFRARFKHLPDCTPLRQCVNCEGVALLRDSLTPDEISRLAQLFTDSRLLEEIKGLDLTIRTLRCLKNMGVVTVGDLVKKSEADMIRMPDFGRKSLQELKEMLAVRGLKFGM